MSKLGMSSFLGTRVDEVDTPMMVGRLCRGDGRRGPGQEHLYGLGGALTDTRYMLSLTFNGPRNAFNPPT